VRRLQPDLVVPVLLAITLVAFAAGSTSVVSVVHAGRAARWVALLALFAAVAAMALRQHALALLRFSVAVAAVVFLVLAVESAAWSVNPRLTLERAATFVLLLATAAALAAVCAGEPEAVRRALWGIVAGAFAVTVLGLLVLAFDHNAAVENATLDLPTRYRGFGENPNTVALLLALCLPVVTWLALHSRSRRELVLAIGAGLAFDASIAASGSRGAIVAGFAGTFVVLALTRSSARVRLASAAAVAALLAATIVVALAPTSKGEGSAPKQAHPVANAPRPKPGYLDVQGAYPLEFDVGTMAPGEAAPTHRTLFGLTGRGEAWRGAIDQANKRPALGYGFGTEDRVFVDRYANFAGGLPENSYIGIYMQLGAVGLAAFLGLVGVLAFGMVRARMTPEATVSLAVLVSALVLAVVQSYIYSVGDIGTVTVWVCSFLGLAAVGRRVTA
jgi:O-antigen ligase